MFRRRSFGLLVAPLFFFVACSRGVPTSSTTNASPGTSSSSTATTAAAAAAAAATPATSTSASAASASSTLPPPGIAPRFDRAVLLANGHVLMPTKDVVYDWEPFGAGPGVPAVRRVSLGDAGPAHTQSFVPLGGKTFIVAKTDEQDNVRFELWDAEKLAVMRVLEGSYVAEDPLVDFSRDGKRVLLLTCAVPRSNARVCDAGVYDLTTGVLIHRTKLAPLAAKDHNRVAGQISPTGKYFALSGDDFPTEAYDAETGRRIAVADHAAVGNEADIEDSEETAQILHFGFVDDKRLLTATPRVGLRVTELATGRVKSFSFGNGGNGNGGNSSRASSDASPRIVLSPDRTRAATEITRDDGSFGVFVAVFDSDRDDQRSEQQAQREQRQRFVPVPRRVCASLCAMRWSGPKEIVLAPNVEGTPLEFRINTVTGISLTGPYREPPPFEVFGAHFVRGDFDKYATKDKDGKDPKGKWTPEDRSKAYPKGALVTPQGNRINLSALDMGALMSASGNHFFVDGLDGLRLIKSDGTIASLKRAPPEN